MIRRMLPHHQDTLGRATETQPRDRDADLFEQLVASSQLGGWRSGAGREETRLQNIHPYGVRDPHPAIMAG